MRSAGAAHPFGGRASPLECNRLRLCPLWDRLSNRLRLCPLRARASACSVGSWPAAYACLLGEIPIRVGRELGFGGALLTHAVPAAPDATQRMDTLIALLRYRRTPVRPAGRRRIIR